jgi:heme exporter protein A
MLEASNLECVRGERRLFAGVSFRLEGGEMLYLQGRNGSGKPACCACCAG